MAEHRHGNAPWWLQEGTEECPHCGQLYHLEVERRCEACDAPICLHCVDSEAQRCPECAADESP